MMSADLRPRLVFGSAINSEFRHRCPSCLFGRSSRPIRGSPGSSDPLSVPPPGKKMNLRLSGFPHITIRRMQRLSGLDASFLYLETAAQPLHVCSILELDTSTMPGGYTFDRMRDELALRIKAMPQFREKLADSRFNPDHPVWVDDDDFDVDRHLHRIGLPAPGGRQELAEICGHIASLPLDRSRPLWETWVIENIAGTDPHAGGRLAVMTKVHHAGVDGVTGANLMSQLCSTDRKSTRLNSSHVEISYAVFCLKKKMY